MASSVNPELAQKAAAVLSQHLSGQSIKNAMLELAGLARSYLPELADGIDSFCTKGEVDGSQYLYGPRLVNLIGIQHIVVHLLPKIESVRFTVACAKNILPHFENRYPQLEIPSRLLAIVGKSINATVSRDKILLRYDKAVSLAKKLRMRLDTKRARDAFESRRDDALELRPLLVVNVIVGAAWSALVDSASQFYCCVDEVAADHLEICEIESNDASRERGRIWQIRTLESILSNLSRPVS
ncbi:unnamed protein product [Gemmata massiliana]|uniref:Uncharacterized protein n=1 Tax=Gemmata massiliana TaxID=1210884 RepID=A0A6P2CV52_9BACT|nr:hypothetical protein [Gemmata massiliana]VTR93038.1 unnamed protein product [Gemmata massiliana]